MQNEKGDEPVDVGPEDFEWADEKLQKICSYIENDPVKTAWHSSDREGKNALVLAVVLGMRRLNRVLERLVEGFAFRHDEVDLRLALRHGEYWDLLQRPDSQRWISRALDDIKRYAKEEEFKISKEELAEMVGGLSKKLGIDPVDVDMEVMRE